MSDPRRDLLRDQYDMTWALFEYHLDLLGPRDHLWEPAPLCWTVHRGADGRWLPDWAETEPDPIPVPTIAWVTWHIGWWWSVTLDHVLERPVRERTEVTWPGEERAVPWLRELGAEWREALDGLDLDAPTAFPWPEGRTRADTAWWVNAELMKNAAEIGQLRMLRAVQG